MSKMQYDNKVQSKLVLKPIHLRNFKLQIVIKAPSKSTLDRHQ
jgi:hypothetical protein